MLEEDQAIEGDEVTVIWGEPGVECRIQTEVKRL
jgi:hypothetical protein